jgi:hypothetical protein
MNTNCGRRIQVVCDCGKPKRAQATAGSENLTLKPAAAEIAVANQDEIRPNPNSETAPYSQKTTE